MTASAVRFWALPWKVQVGHTSLLFAQTHNADSRFAVKSEGVNRFSKPVPMSTSATVVALVRGLVELQLADNEALACELPESRSRRRKRAVTESNRGCPQRLGLKGPLLVRYRQRSIQKGYGLCQCTIVRDSQCTKDNHCTE